MKFIKRFMLVGLVLPMSFSGVYAMDFRQRLKDLIAKYSAEFAPMKARDNVELFDAARRGDVDEVVKLLDELGEKADSCTAIGVASEGNHHEVVKLLAEWCCCSARKVEEYHRPRSEAELLVEFDPKKASRMNSPFLPPRPRGGSAALAIYVLEADGSLRRDSSNNKPGALLVKAMRQGDANTVVDIIRRSGFPANAVLALENPLGNGVESTFQYAMHFKNPSLLNGLLIAGADINYGAGSLVGTSLHKAVAELDERMVNYLLRNGANVNAVDATGTTPLHVIASLAASPAALPIAQALVNAGADTNAVNNKGQRPGDLLERNNYTKGIADLIQAPEAEAAQFPETVEEKEELASVPEYEEIGEPQGRLQVRLVNPREWEERMAVHQPSGAYQRQAIAMENP